MPIEFMRPGWLVPVLFVLVGLLVGLWLARLRVRFRVARSRRLGLQGERRARRILRRAGYRIVDEQTSYRGQIVVGGEAVTFLVRVDAIVEKDGRRYVAEFKAGAKAALVSTRATRRQLLEYAWLSNTDGVLLVDATAGRVLQVEFPGLCGPGMPLHATA